MITDLKELEAIKFEIEAREIQRKMNRHRLMSQLGPKEAVDHPSHYNQGKIEVIDAIEDWRLNFNLGNAVKYIARCDHKGKKAEDLKKAIWYLQRELKKGQR